MATAGKDRDLSFQAARGRVDDRRDEEDLVSGMFLRTDDGLVALAESPYAAEAELQELIARYPSLVAGDQITPDDPRRWLLVSREMPLAAEEGGGGRWSVDHLLVDQDAVPALVEVKRSTDTRIRREVIGQMLDYAANSLLFWPADTLRAAFEQNCRARAVEPAEALLDFLPSQTDQDAFWEQVAANLAAGRLRLIFVADRIPTELLRVVEFLDAHLDQIDVVAVEVRQHLAGAQQALVSRVVGRAAARPPIRPSTREWDEASFLAAVAERCGEREVRAAERILEWSRERGLRLAFGRGAKDAAFYPTRDVPSGSSFWPIGVFPSGPVEVAFQWMALRTPFDQEAMRRDFQQRLNAIPGVAIPDEKTTKRPSFPLGLLADERAMRSFLEALAWAFDQAESGRYVGTGRGVDDDVLSASAGSATDPLAP